MPSRKGEIGGGGEGKDGGTGTGIGPEGVRDNRVDAGSKAVPAVRVVSMTPPDETETTGAGAYPATSHP